jgi:hypothetical protein
MSSQLRSLPFACMVLVLCVGCEEHVNTGYGKRGMGGANSVNGTSVLADMFESAGHRVKSWRYLSPMLNDANVIVWAPDDFEPPTDEVWNWLLLWLEEPYTQRTLIYIGRDYDAGPEYWRAMRPKAPTAQQGEYRQRQLDAEGSLNNQRGVKLSRDKAGDLLTFQRDPRQQVKSLTGPWAAEVDASETQIVRETRIEPDSDATLLLGDEKGNPLVSEWQEQPSDYNSQPTGRLVVVENGSFLLNLPLVNKEHRKLAGKLVAHIGPPPQDVVFLESGSGGPSIHDADPKVEPPTGFALFGVWPIGAVLMQLAVLGLVFALMKWPVFGVPRKLQRVSLTDFGKHISALGRLLAATNDRAYAYERLREYFKTEK